MILAELEVFHSRPIAPTRRVALGHRDLPVSPAPGFGGLLLAGIVAAFAGSIAPDLHPDLVRLTHQLEQGHRVPQPRLRHRYQTDHVGLHRRRHRLMGDGEQFTFDLEHADGMLPAPQVLAAVYAAGQLPPASRPAVMRLVRRGLAWQGAIDRTLVEYLTGRTASWSPAAFADPVDWAAGVLGLPTPPPNRSEIQRRFRELLRGAHPDHGAPVEGAAQRIADLTEARRILLWT